MSDTYIAWNGDEYPMPPPDGWELKRDGRYWPADREPPEPEPELFTPPTAGSITAQPTSAPPPTAAPPTAPGAPTGGPSPLQPAGITPPPTATPAGFGSDMTAPPPGATAQQWQAGEPGAKNGRGKVALIIIGVILIGIAGCTVAVARAGQGVFDAIEDFAEEIDAAKANVTFNTCGIEGDRLVAAGTILNDRDVTTDYEFSVLFTQPDGSRDRSLPFTVAQLPSGETGEFRIENPVPVGSSEFECEVVDMTLVPLGFLN